ncbi:MAG TPA: hypothetical protein VMJ30_08300 [Gemmatimonadales bacterium]|nr:hypothetical protein [Gemmatimonadales bacterium]
MSDHDEVYGQRRLEKLQEMLRSLAERIQELDQANALLSNVPELQRRLGDLRSELFHYEVRATYDTPEVSAHRRLVEEAEQSDPFLYDDPEDDQPWRSRPAD